jgi:hypothetical protein
MELFKDTHLVKLELLSNARTVDNALNYIRIKQSKRDLSTIQTEYETFKKYEMRTAISK